MQDATPEQIDAFITRWEKSGGHERGSGQQFLLEFCELLGLEKPAPPVAENERNAYTFERRVDRKKPDGTSAPNWIDLYKSAHFVLETKQGVNPRRDKSDPDQPLLPDLAPATINKSLGHGHRGSAAWDKALDRAHAQGERYIHLLPQDEGRPPFLIVCDVGHCFDLYAEFSGTGGQYEPFPTPRKRRVLLRDLHDPDVRERFRKIWHDPHSLDPSKYAAKVTREVAKALADLAKSLEKDGHDPQITAGFLQRCLFTMFAEDVELLPKKSFQKLLEDVRNNSGAFVSLVSSLWREMANDQQIKSTFSTIVRAEIPPFNGGLFKEATALPLRPDQIDYLLHAASQDWTAVEPAIFGTLLERALDPRERHKLGAHYTPRSYVERLVRPTLIEPLRAEWDAVKIAAAQLDDQGKTKDARKAVEDFHHKLAKTRVLDPACGSGNFLYVALELLKRLEAEVLDLFEALGGDRKLEMDTTIIRPSNFLGIELNPRAAAIAQLVLWIGYFQWHQRTTGKADTNDRPLLPKHNSIECRDAVLAYDEKIPRRDPDTGEVMTIWDGRTTKPHPVTGKEVPDDTARTVVFDYLRPKIATWPKADYIVGNPPFIGVRRMRILLSSSYVDALRTAWAGLPATCDFVMYWWETAARLCRNDQILGFGFITTKSITQSSNRVILEPHLSAKSEALRINYAIPNHPWIDAQDGAAVRVAFTSVSKGSGAGTIQTVKKERRLAGDSEDEDLVESFSIQRGIIHSNLRIGVNVSDAKPLVSNKKMSYMGVTLVGDFEILPLEAATYRDSSGTLPRFIRKFVIGQELTQKSRDQYVIDFFGLNKDEAESACPRAYQYIIDNVKPHREKNDRENYREQWWLFGESRPGLRDAVSKLKRYIATPETPEHRIFLFLDADTLADHSTFVFPLDDAYFLGVLSTSIHCIWSIAKGGRMGKGNQSRYRNTECFDPFPFPALEEGPLKQRIRDLGERLDAHRKARQAAHPELTLTGIYNVLEKLRAEQPLNDKEKKIHDDGLVTLLKQIHDDLDEAVYEAYGWSDILAALDALPNVYDFATGGIAIVDLDPAGFDAHMRECEDAIEQELLKRLVALNHERAAEEKRGLIRWLRPDYQAPASTPQPQQKEIDLGEDSSSSSSLKTENLKLKTPTWPTALSAQVTAIQQLLPTTGPDPSALAAHFGKRTKARIQQIEEILKTLEELGKL